MKEAACTMTQEEIDSKGMGHRYHKRRSDKSQRLGFICKAISGGPKVRAED